jgi:hypothetical protein
MNKNLGNCSFGVDLTKFSIFLGKIMELIILKKGKKIKIKETPGPHIFEYYLLKYANYEYTIYMITL